MKSATTIPKATNAKNHIEQPRADHSSGEGSLRIISDPTGLLRRPLQPLLVDVHLQTVGRRAVVVVPQVGLGELDAV